MNSMIIGKQRQGGYLPWSFGFGSGCREAAMVRRSGIAPGALQGEHLYRGKNVRNKQCFAEVGMGGEGGGGKVVPGGLKTNHRTVDALGMGPRSEWGGGQGLKATLGA